MDSDPQHSHAWQAWAVAEKMNGNIELSRFLFSQGIKLCASHGPLYQAYAVMEAQQGNYDLARNLFSEAITHCPNHAQSYQAWACLEVRNGNLEVAKKLAARGILKSGADHAALWTVLGVIEDRLGQPVKAKTVFEKAIAKFPT